MSIESKTIESLNCSEFETLIKNHKDNQNQDKEKFYLDKIKIWIANNMTSVNYCNDCQETTNVHSDNGMFLCDKCIEER